MGFLHVEAVFRRMASYFLRGLQRTVLVTGHDARSRQPGRCRIRLPEFDFEVIYQPDWKHQPAEVLSRLPTTRIDELPVANGVLRLMLTGMLWKGGKSGSYTKVWQSVPCINDTHIAKTALLEALQRSDVTFIKRRVGHQIWWQRRWLTPILQKLPLLKECLNTSSCKIERESAGQSTEDRWTCTESCTSNSSYAGTVHAALLVLLVS